MLCWGPWPFFAGGTEVGKYKFLLLLLPLYSKIKKEEVLDQYTRGRIHGFITANPGAHYSVIKSALGLNNGTLAYHLRLLERVGYVQSRRDGIYKRFFPSGYPSDGAMFSTLQERIIEQVIENPGVTLKELAEAMDKSPQVMDYHLRWMRRQKLLRAEKDGKLNRYFIDERAEVKTED